MTGIMWLNIAKYYKEKNEQMSFLKANKEIPDFL